MNEQRLLKDSMKPTLISGQKLKDFSALEVKSLLSKNWACK
jgi:hypothetical protein